MNYRDKLENIIPESFLLELATFYYQREMYPHMRSERNMELLKAIPTEYQFLALAFKAKLVKGEEYQSTRTIENKYEFQVFKTWWDHLKFKLNTKFRRKLRVEYQAITKYRADIVPVTVNTFCPHYGSELGKDPYLHLQFMRKIQL